MPSGWCSFSPRAADAVPQCQPAVPDPHRGGVLVDRQERHLLRLSAVRRGEQHGPGGAGRVDRQIWAIGGGADIPGLHGTLFSSTFTESLQYTPDALCLAFVVACVACVARTTGVWWAVAGGVLFGLAWLTRSSAILVLPAIAVYLLLAHGWRRAVARLAVLGGTAFLIALPWLVHTARVWGNPLRSDASYYLWQEYHARAFGGSVPRYWHSTQVPASLGELLKREPGAVAGFVLRASPCNCATW